MIMGENKMNALGLYIHIPFCERKCFYCSFAVSVGQSKRMERYVNSVKKELLLINANNFRTVYIGGGTPSYLDSANLRRLLDTVKETCNMQALVEFTIEMNPEDVSRQKLRLIKDAGVTRVSLGAQSFNNKYLKILGRAHDELKIVESFALIRDAGFENVSLDLIISVPGQTDSELKEDLRNLCGLEAEHLSLYSLTVEKNSRFYTRKLKLDDDKTQRRHYKIVCEILEQNGFNQYEISNFSKKNRESIHNRNYWLGGNYYGVGLSAHSHINGKRYWNVPKLIGYIDRVENNLSPQEGFEDLTQDQRFKECLLFCLRMNEGINLENLDNKFKGCVTEGLRLQLNELVHEGYLKKKGNNFMTTFEGKVVLDEISARLI